MKLRELRPEDAVYMLEWMHDPSVVEKLQTDFSQFSIEDCNRFIAGASDTSVNMHLAIADDNDEYMGTVSLKHITDKNAEFAIAIRKCAMGRKISIAAMKEIIAIGFEKNKLESIYWCVDPVNVRAVRFYDKNGFVRVEPQELVIFEGAYTAEQIEKYIWYEVVKP